MTFWKGVGTTPSTNALHGRVIIASTIQSGFVGAQCRLHQKLNDTRVCTGLYARPGTVVLCLIRDVRFGPIYHGGLGRGASIGEIAAIAIEELPDSFVLIGFSLGGYVTHEIARRIPERVTVLMVDATPARADTLEQIKPKEIAVRLLSVPFRGMSPSGIALVVPDRRSDRSLLDAIRNMGARLANAS